jgi:hypothetical protein
MSSENAAFAGETADAARRLSLARTKDLIVYEIAPKGFTSPHGPESGIFNSLKAIPKAIQIIVVCVPFPARSTPHSFVADATIALVRCPRR